MRLRLLRGLLLLSFRCVTLMTALHCRCCPPFFMLLLYSHRTHQRFWKMLPTLAQWLLLAPSTQLHLDGDNTEISAWDLPKNSLCSSCSLMEHIAQPWITLPTAISPDLSLALIPLWCNRKKCYTLCLLKRPPKCLSGASIAKLKSVS